MSSSNEHHLISNQRRFMRVREFLSSPWVILMVALSGSPALAQMSIAIDIEKPPFEYSHTQDDNRVSRLIAKMASKEIKLAYTHEQGYLRSLLAALEIPESSQTLVFSKTSMQVKYISHRNPRAIYFNDDTYVGWVRGSSLIEISTADPKLGAAFYTFDMASLRPKLKRSNDDCLGCHASSLTGGIPGHTLRSVSPNLDGSVNPQTKSFVTDHTSPFSERWGGWYVTGRHGDMRHMGNAVLRGVNLDTQGTGNWLSLRDEFDTTDYLSPHSDIVALMVLAHQSKMHNTMTRADFSVRQLLHERAQQPETAESDLEWQTQLRLIAKNVVDGLLFVDETPLTSDVQGSQEVFRVQFTDRGPKDAQMRSLREFDLSTRLFKYPCSYLIDSLAFDSLQEELRSQVLAQLLDVLQGRNESPQYGHLTPTMRKQILEILLDTKAEFKATNQTQAVSK